jgi:transposase
MSQPKFDTDVYGALHEQGLSNREIAAKLGVDEASVRRGLKKYTPRPVGRRFMVTVVEVD